MNIVSFEEAVASLPDTSPITTLNGTLVRLWWSKVLSARSMSRHMRIVVDAYKDSKVFMHNGVPILGTFDSWLGNTTGWLVLISGTYYLPDNLSALELHKAVVQAAHQLHTYPIDIPTYARTLSAPFDYKGECIEKHASLPVCGVVLGETKYNSKLSNEQRKAYASSEGMSFSQVKVYPDSAYKETMTHWSLLGCSYDHVILTMLWSEACVELGLGSIGHLVGDRGSVFIGIAYQDTRSNTANFGTLIQERRFTGAGLAALLHFRDAVLREEITEFNASTLVQLTQPSWGLCVASDEYDRYKKHIANRQIDLPSLFLCKRTVQ